MLKNILIEYSLRQVYGEGEFGPFITEEEAYKFIVEEELYGYELKKIVSFFPF